MKKNEHIKRWGEKPYYSLDYYLKKTFGEKISSRYETGAYVFEND